MGLDATDRVLDRTDKPRVRFSFYDIMSNVLSADDKEKRTIDRMKETKEGKYTLIGELNADGSYDNYVQKYIEYIGTNA